MIRTFVSYRHKSEPAPHVLRQMREKLGDESVLSDQEFIGGPTLNAQIQSAIDRCGAVIVLIDPFWIQRIPDLHRDADWVRIEIALGLRTRVPVIPILINGAPMPDADDLPRDVQPLVYAKRHELDLDDPESGIKVVLATLEKIEEGYARAYRTYQRAMDQARKGAWSEAVEIIDQFWREILHCAASVKTNHIVPMLEELRRDLLALDGVEQAFQSGRFEHARFALADACHLKRPFALAGHAAEIGLAAAAALRCGNGHALDGERIRLAILQRGASGALVPGATSVKVFLDKASDILKRRAEVEKETTELCDNATRSYEAPIFIPLFVDDVLVDSAGVQIEIREEVLVHGSAGLDLLHASGMLKYSTSVASNDSLVDWIDAAAAGAEMVPTNAAAKTVLATIKLRNFLRSVDRTTFLELSKFFDEPAAKNSFRATPDFDAATNRYPAMRGLHKFLHIEGAETIDKLPIAPLKALPSPPLPAANLSDISFTVTAPTSIAPGARVRIAIWAHRNEDQGYVIREARRDTGEGNGREASLLEVRMQSRDLQVLPEQQPMTWRGRAVRAAFTLTDLQSPAGRVARVTADVLLDGLRVARLQFPIRIGRATTAVGFLAADEIRHRSAFVCYAEEDRDAVRLRLERLAALVPAMIIDDRCVRLRGRRKWGDVMRSVISRHNCLYLFWSSAASRSPQVGREWRCALEQGSEFISGIVLDESRPPAELDDVLFRRREPPGARGGRAS